VRKEKIFLPMFYSYRYLTLEFPYLKELKLGYIKKVYDIIALNNI